MKKLLLFLLFPLSLISFQANATHVMGADISWDSIGKDSFLIKVNIYRDCNGIQLSKSDLTLSTNCGVVRLKTTMTSMGDVTPVCASTATRCQSRASTFKYGIQMFQLSAIYDASTHIKNGCCEATITWGQCCRNNAITTGAASNNFYVEAKMNSCMGISSPKWSAPAVGIGCLGRDIILDNGVITKDSVVHSLSDPLQTATNKTTWSSPYSSSAPVYFLGFPNASRPFPRGLHFDSETGELAFRPMKEEQTVICSKVDIYHKGKYAGYMKRDFQFIVIKCPNNSPPVLSGIDITSPYPANFTTTVCAGKKLCFLVSASDRDSLDSVSITQNGGIPGGKLQVLNPNGQRDSVMYCWEPTLADVSSIPHRVVLSAKDNACPTPGITARTYNIIVKKPYQYDLDLKLSSANNCGSYYLTVKDKNGRTLTDVDWYENDSIYIGSGDSIAHTFLTAGKRKISVKVGDCVNQQVSDTLTVPAVGNLSLSLADQAVCQNVNLLLRPTLTGQTGPITYKWNVDPRLGYTGSTTGSSVNLAFINRTIASYPISLIVKDSIGCTDTAVANITSKSNTSVNIEKDQVICEGSTSQLNLAQYNGGGTWSGTNVSGNTMDLTGLSAGAYLIAFSYEDSLSCASDSALIILRNGPAIFISNDFSNCTNSNETVQVFQNPGGGQWTGKGISGSIFDPAVAGKGQHYLTYTYTDSFGCSGSDSLLATVYDYVPTITVTDSVKACSNGDIATITAQPSGGGWIGPGIASTSNTIQVDPTLLGSGDYTYKYGYRDSNSCTNSDSTVVRVAQAPVAAFKIIDTVSFVGDTVLIKNLSMANINSEYQWKIGSPAFLFGQGYAFRVPIDSADTFDVALVVRDPKTGCKDSTEVEDGIVVLLNTGTHYVIDGLEVYPNPSNGLLNVRSPKNGIMQLALIDLSGKTVYKNTTTSGAGSIDIGHLENGLYLLQIDQNGQRHTQLLMKE